MRELADAARQWYAENGRPWFYARQIEHAGTGGRKTARRRNGIFLPAASRSIRRGAGRPRGAGRGERGQGMRGTRATALAGIQAGRIFFSGNVRLGGRRTSGHGRQRPHLRLGGPARRGGAAALQPGLFGLGHFGPDQIVEFAPAKRRAPFRRQARRSGNRNAPAQKIAAGRHGHHAQSGKGAGPRPIDSLRRLVRCPIASIAARLTGTHRRKSKTCARCCRTRWRISTE